MRPRGYTTRARVCGSSNKVREFSAEIAKSEVNARISECTRVLSHAAVHLKQAQNRCLITYSNQVNAPRSVVFLVQYCCRRRCTDGLRCGIGPLKEALNSLSPSLLRRVWAQRFDAGVQAKPRAANVPVRSKPKIPGNNNIASDVCLVLCQSQSVQNRSIREMLSKNIRVNPQSPQSEKVLLTISISV